MRPYISFFILWVSLIPLDVFSQSDHEDVIYMKNGSVYRGSIIEQVPFVSYKIEIFGGTVIEIAAADVEKITKEDRIYFSRKPKPVFHYREKGFFVTGMANFGVEEGFSAIIGYKFGQFGMLGIGTGIDYNPAPIGGPQAYNVAGGYVPVFLYYSGDILKRRITPFYNFFAGYAFVVSIPAYDNDEGFTGGTLTTFQGGFRGGGGFGVRFYTYKHKVNFTLGLNLAVQNAIYWSSGFGLTGGYGPNGYQNNSYTASYYSGSIWTFIPTLNFGVSFLK